jgi:hypothetical protein
VALASANTAADTSEPPAALRSPRRLNRATAWPGHGGVPHLDPSCDGGGHPRSTRYQYCEIDLNICVETCESYDGMVAAVPECVNACEGV